MPSPALTAPEALWALASGALIGLSYLVGLAFVLGVAYRLYLYLSTPALLPIPTTPAPTTAPGAVLRVLGDALLFQNLLKYDRWLWLGSWLWHACLFLVLWRHLRYVLYPVPDWVVEVQTLGVYAGFLFPLPLLFLLGRRLTLRHVLYVSGLPDLAVLFWLLAIAGSGILLKYLVHVNLVEVKAFVLGLLSLHPVSPPAHPLFLVHYLLVLGLLLYFPFSKLMHAGGLFFSPTRYQPYTLTPPASNGEGPSGGKGK